MSHIQDTNHIAGSYENVGIVVWHHETTPEAVTNLATMLWQLADTREEAKIGLIQIVEAKCAPLSSDARQAIGELLQSGASRIECSTVVYEGQGFRAATVRGIVTGLAMFTRTSFPHHVFATVPAAIQWHVAHLRRTNPRLSETGLVGAVAALRNKLSASAPPT
ncbi:MAG: hypothetical protein OXU20_14635 [Myxococcales bacterium]|nr:hypothetical protein [Myxococcales bacterium]MDD9970257.1 hypothetical protein [Myxococcales bacterium]